MRGRLLAAMQLTLARSFPLRTPPPHSTLFTFPVLLPSQNELVDISKELDQTAKDTAAKKPAAK
jgi:hypothetical protein